MFLVSFLFDRLLAVSFLDRRALSQALVPSPEVGVLVFSVKRLDNVGKEAVHGVLPRNEAKVDICPVEEHVSCCDSSIVPSVYLQLLANEVSLALEDVVQNTPDTLNLLEVALLGAGNILGVELLEEDGLAVVRTLAGHLEVEVLLKVPLLGAGGDVELVLLVVGLDEVLGDGARLPQDNVVVVGVLDGGQTAVGVDLDESLGLRVGDAVEVIGDAELFKDDDNLLRVGTRSCES